MNSPEQDKHEIIALLKSFSPLPSTSCTDALSGWMRRAQQSCAPKMIHPRLSLLLAAHGFADSESKKHYKNFLDTITKGVSLVNDLCVAANTDLRVYDMDLDHPNENIFLSDVHVSCPDESFVRALAYGMMAVEPGLDLLAAHATGPGSDNAAHALLHLHGARINQDLSSLTVEKIIQKSNKSNGFEALQKIGGFEMAALAGLITAARLANCPVLVSGTTAAAVLWCMVTENEHSLDHCAYLDHNDRNFNLPNNLTILTSPYAHNAQDAVDLGAYLTHLRVHLLFENHRHAPHLASAA